MSVVDAKAMKNVSWNDKKLPLKRFEGSFHKCGQVAIPMHLNLLTQHSKNITKFQTLEEWDRVHQEQVNASRTVKQLTADIWEMERVRNQIRNEDLPEFDKRFLPLKVQSMNAIQEFISEHKDVGNPLTFLKKDKRESGDIIDGIEDEIKTEEEDNSLNELQVQRKNSQENMQCANTRTVASSWRTLYQDLLALNKLIKGFAETAQNQQPMIDEIENNLDDTAENVDQGTRQLGKAVKMQATMYPVAGALIGCFAGPVGMLVGAKVGLAAALGGSVLGYLGGKLLKKRNEKTIEMVDIELNQLSKQKEKSSSENLLEVNT